MQKVKQIQLDRGINTINISSSELGLMSSKIPIALLPADHIIQSVSFNTIQKLRSTKIDNQESSNSCIRFHNVVGTFDDREKYLTWSSDPADVIGKSVENSGSYFDNPIAEPHNTQIFLETWVSTKVWTMEADLLYSAYYGGTFGTQDAAVCAAGYWDTVGYQHCEKYNGTSWSATGSIISATMRTCAGAGTQTAGVIWGGFGPVTTTEEFNGSTWASSGALNTGNYSQGGCGTQTSTLSAGGLVSASRSAISEEYNGTSWASANNLNIASNQVVISGSQTSSLKYNGGFDSAALINTTESYNGTTWSIDNNIIISVINRGTCSTNALSYAGQKPDVTHIYETQEYNGSSWSIGNNVNIPCEAGGCGTTERAYKIGGRLVVGATNKTESFSGTNLNKISILGKTKLTFLVS